MKFELTILGCGSAVPTLQRNASAQVLNVLERYFLIDCGEGTQHQLRRFGVPYGKINHIFISHLHGDHFFGLIGLLSTFSMQNRRGELHVYADRRLEEIVRFQLQTMGCQLSYPLTFHALGREPALVYEDRVVRVFSFPLKHRYEAPVCGFRFEERERERTIDREATTAWEVPVAWMQRLRAGEDYVTPAGEVVENERLTVDPPKARSYAYMTDTLFRERFADYARGVDLLYHEATYGEEFADLAKANFHSTARQAARMAELCGAGRLLLGHYSSRYADPSPLLTEARNVFPTTDLCYDGAVFEVPAERRRI